MEPFLDLAASLWLPALAATAVAVWEVVAAPGVARRTDTAGGNVWVLVTILAVGPWATTLQGLVAQDEEAGQMIVLLSQIGTLVATGAAVMSVLERQTHRRIAAGIGAFYGAALLGGLWGTEPAVTQPLWLTPLLLLAVARRDLSERWIVQVGAWCTSYFVVASLLMMMLPDIAFNTDEDRTLFGFERLRGVMLHPNGMAAIAVMCIAFQLYREARWRRPLVAASVVALLLAQSRTGWVMLLVVLYVLRPPGRRWAVLVRRGAAVGVTAVLVWATSMPGAIGPRIETFIGDDGTLNGRAAIWDLALAEHADSPWFGYGPLLLNEEYRFRHGAQIATAAGQAHNQIVQTLGDSGYAGVVGLLILVVTWRRSARSGIASAMLALVALRAVTETPLRPTGPGASSFLLVMVAATIAARSERPVEVSGREARHRLPGAGRTGGGAHPASSTASGRSRVPHLIADGPSGCVGPRMATTLSPVK